MLAILLSTYPQYTTSEYVSYSQMYAVVWSIESIQDLPNNET